MIEVFKLRLNVFTVVIGGGGVHKRLKDFAVKIRSGVETIPIECAKFVYSCRIGWNQRPVDYTYLLRLPVCSLYL